MTTATFASFDVPAADTRVGELTKKIPGCQVDLVGRPLVTDGRHAYQLAYRVTGLPPEEKDRVEAGMRAVYDWLETLAWNPAKGTWDVHGVIAVENISSPGLRLTAGLFGLADAPWVTFREGTAHVRLHPRRRDEFDVLSHQAAARLFDLGLRARPEPEEAPLEDYLARVAILDALEGGPNANGAA